MAVPPGVQKTEFYAGFYFRTKTRVRFWGWGNPPAQTVEPFDDRPWAQLAEWLRSVHSVAKSGAETPTQKPGTSLLAVEEDEAASQPAKQR